MDWGQGRFHPYPSGMTVGADVGRLLARARPEDRSGDWAVGSTGPPGSGGAAGQVACNRGLSQGVGVQPLLALAGRHLPQGVDGGAMGGRAWAMGLFLTIYTSSPKMGPAGLGVGTGGVLE